MLKSLNLLNFGHTTHCWLFVLVSVLASCSGESQFRMKASIQSIFRDEDLGVPVGGLADQNTALVSMLDANGADQVAEVKTEATLVVNVAESKTIPLPAGTRMLIIAENGDWYRVLATLLAEDAVTKVEGFIAKPDVTFVGLQSEGVELVPQATTERILAKSQNAMPVQEKIVLVTRPSGQESESYTTPIVTFKGQAVDNGGTGGPGSVIFDGMLPKARDDYYIFGYEPAGAQTNTSGPQTNGTAVSTDLPVASTPAVPASQPAVPEAVVTPVVVPEVQQPVAAPPAASAPAPVVEEVASCQSAKFILRENDVAGRMECKDGRDGEKCVLPGEILRDPKKGLKKRDAVFQVKGTAHEWRVDVVYHAGQMPSFLGQGGSQPAVGDLVADKVIAAAQGSQLTEIPLREIIPGNQLFGGNRKFRFTPRIGGKSGESCVIRMDVVSPIVLALEGQEMAETIPLADADLRFDLLGDGVPLQTGWVAPSFGFLALDLDGNGVISSGRELFGNGTRGAGGETFENGYLGLAQHDFDRDGFISARDPIYDRLVVWTDRNSDGVSQPEEIRSVKSYGIEHISLSYGPSVRHGVPRFGDNDVRFEARYFGPKHCPKEGCLSFDVFFATAQTLASK